MGAQKDHSEDSEVVKVIISTLRGSTDGRSLKIKELRKSVLLQLNCASDDKDAKKRFKKAVQGLESSKRLSLSEDGICKLKKSEIKKEKKSKKRKKDTEVVSESLDESPDTPPSKKPTVGDVKEDDGHDQQNDSGEREAPIKKNIPCKGNPTGVTRLFVGNLPFAVDEASLKAFLLDSEGRGEITHIKWITDKETGRFYGSAFIEVATSKDGAVAMAKNGQSLMGRDIKLNYAPAREGDIWPPRNNVVTGGQAQSKGIKSMSEKPDGCCKLFIGNLSYDIDDDATHKFFGTVDAEVKAIRLRIQETLRGSDLLNFGIQNRAKRQQL
eukprot:CAMPEP_0116076176 /NCGR_PEP_ID=MMETSP0322-20121206/17093_1 /TAXON_ID=163516 /ORGANISM="Leptocylindrus danicus var. apora, Strain B651" /LENGTH=325 /DNA_ID=CAMNT_0003566413 /DNA_START=833 /DNA_END=1810 /DNA_ORIENTATION=-